MSFKTTPWIAVALLYTGMAGNALAATVYTDRAAFEAALLSSTLEDFENEEAFGLGDFPNGRQDLALTNFSLSSIPDAIKIMDAPHSGSHNTTTGGENYLYLDTDMGLQGVITADVSLNQPVDAFGFNYTGVFEPGTDFSVTIGSDVFDLELNNPEDTPLFWGIIGLGSFTDVTLYTSSDSAYGVDDVIFGSAIPLPPAIWLFGTGLIALAGGASTRRTGR